MLSNHIKRYIRICYTFDMNDQVERCALVEDVLPHLAKQRVSLTLKLLKEREGERRKQNQHARELLAIREIKTAMRTARQTLISGDA